MDEFKLMDDVKKALCYVSLDFDQELYNTQADVRRIKVSMLLVIYEELVGALIHQADCALSDSFNSREPGARARAISPTVCFASKQRHPSNDITCCQIFRRLWRAT